MDNSFQPSAWQIDISIRQEEHRKDEELAFMRTGRGDTFRRAMISNLLSNGTLTCLSFNGAYPYTVDRTVIEAVRGACEVREIAHFDKPDNSPGLILWRLSAGRSGPQDGKTRSTGAGSDT